MHEPVIERVADHDAESLDLVRAAAMCERPDFSETEPFLDTSYVDDSMRMTYLRLEL